MKDYYALMGVDQKATKAEIKKNYRKLAAKYHPDKNSDPKAAPIFIAVTEAYDVLSNRKSRAAYDLQRWEALKNKQSSGETYVVTPRESTRSRRNKAQQKRGANYHNTKSEGKKKWLLILEALHILSRYALFILGISLMLLILYSAWDHVLPGFESSLGVGLGTCVFIVALLWCLVKLVLHIYTEVKKDIALFSIYYEILHRKAMFISGSVFFLCFVIYLSIFL